MKNRSLLSRRNFLVSTALLAAGSAASLDRLAGFRILPQRKGRQLISFEKTPRTDVAQAKDGYDLAETRRSTTFGCAILDLDTDGYRAFETPFSAHYVAPLGERSKLGFAASKFGRNYAVIDFEGAKLQQLFELPEDHRLAGHAAVSDDGRFICATAVQFRSSSRDPSEMMPAILLFDRVTYKPVDRIPLPWTYPVPHDCQFLPSSSTLITTGGNSIWSIDVASRKVTEQKIGFTESTSALRHFAMSSRGDLAIQSNIMTELQTPDWKYRRSEVAFRVRGDLGVISPPTDWTNAFNTELVDLRFRGEGDVVATVLARLDSVFFWNLETKALAAVVPIRHPRRVGLTHSGHQFAVYTPSGLYSIDAKTLSYDPKSVMFERELTALHDPSVYVRWSHLTSIA